MQETVQPSTTLPDQAIEWESFHNWGHLLMSVERAAGSEAREALEQHLNDDTFWAEGYPSTDRWSHHAWTMGWWRHNEKGYQVALAMSSDDDAMDDGTGGKLIRMINEEQANAMLKKHKNDLYWWVDKHEHGSVQYEVMAAERGVVNRYDFDCASGVGILVASEDLQKAYQKARKKGETFASAKQAHMAWAEAWLHRYSCVCNGEVYEIHVQTRSFDGTVGEQNDMGSGYCGSEDVEDALSSVDNPFVTGGILSVEHPCAVHDRTRFDVETPSDKPVEAPFVMPSSPKRLRP